MIRPISHPGTGRLFDVTAQTSADRAFLAELHGLPAREQGLFCETAGGSDDDRRVSVVHGFGWYWVRHLPGHAHPGDHGTPMTDAHKRGQEYAYGELDRGGVPPATEISSNNGTRSDVIGFGAVVVAPEIQASPKNGAKGVAAIKRRDTQAHHATAITTPGYERDLPCGIHPIWTQIHDGKADWLYQVPSVGSSIRYAQWEDHLPKPGSVGAVGVRSIDPEPCRPGSRWNSCPYKPGGYCSSWHGYATVREGVGLGEVFVLAANGLLLPFRYRTGYVYLTDPASIDLYTELGDEGTWTPGKPMSARPRSFGPCRYRVHTEEDEQGRLVRERVERHRAELKRAQDRFERDQLLNDNRWDMYRLARLRKEGRERLASGASTGFCIDGDVVFLCETCGRTHPLREHRKCREETS